MKRTISSAICAVSIFFVFLFFPADSSQIFKRQSVGLLQDELVADLNGDGCVDGKDLIILGRSYNCVSECDPEDTECGPENIACYNPIADITGPEGETPPPEGELPLPDGIVDGYDLDALLSEFGEGCE